MKNEKLIEEIYDLLEMYDFNELSDTQKDLVLKNVSQKEYEDLRSTLADTKEYFADSAVEKSYSQPSLVRKIAGYRIELYKVAAIILMIIAFSLAFDKIRPSSKNLLLAENDTVYVRKTDTVYIETKDTVEKIKEKIVYVKAKEHFNNNSSIGDIPETTTVKNDCSKEICPDDLIIINENNSKNNISNDIALAAFTIPIN